MSDAIPENQQTTTTQKPKPVRGWRRFYFRLIAVLLGLGFFAAVELMLIILNVGQPTSYDDPFVGFSDVHPLFEQTGDGKQHVTSQSRKFYFGEQQFSARKPKNGYRIFCLGGSTVRGRPHETETSFPKWLEVELKGQDPQRAYKVVNCGGVSYASYRLRHLLDEVLTYEPDLIVLATGHNEFLEDRTYHELKSRSSTRRWLTDRIYSLRTVTLARRAFTSSTPQERTMLTEDVKARLDQESGYTSYHRDDQWSKDVLAHYRASVEKMVHKCKEKNVPLVLVDLGSNLRDCPPFKSEHKPGLSQEDLTKWEIAFDLGSREEIVADVPGPASKQAWEKALERYREAEAIDAEHGLLLFRIARCLESLGKHAEARSYYVQAKEWDVCPLRMKEEMHKILHTIAQQQNVPLVDANQQLSLLALHQTPGFDLYVDHVHPTIAGHQRIAQALFTEMRGQKLLSPAATEWNATERRLGYRKHFAQLPANYLTGGKQRIQWVENWARRWKLVDEVRPLNANGHVRFGNRLLEIGRNSEAQQSFAKSLTINSQAEDDLVALAYSFLEQGRADSAQVIVESLLAHPATATNRKNHRLMAMIVAHEQDKERDFTQSYQQYQAEPTAEKRLPQGWSPLIQNALQHVQ